MIDSKPIVVVGSINMDLVVRVERIPVAGETVPGFEFQIYPGGKGANQAVAIARLGYPVCLVGRVGSDSFGEQLRGHLERAKVDISAVRTMRGSSGMATILVSEAGDNCIVVTPGANANLTPVELEQHRDQIREAGMVLTQLETPVETVALLAGMCAEFEVPLVLDPAPAQSIPDDLFGKTTWITPNETEAQFYAGTDDLTAIIDEFRRQGARGVILKLGSRGIRLSGQKVQDTAVQAFKVNAVDTTAAGDAFNGAFAVSVQGQSRGQRALRHRCCGSFRHPRRCTAFHAHHAKTNSCLQGEHRALRMSQCL